MLFLRLLPPRNPKGTTKEPPRNPQGTPKDPPRNPEGTPKEPPRNPQGTPKEPPRKPLEAYGTQRNPTSLKSFIARQPYKNVHLLHLLHLLHLPPYSPPWSAKLKLSALKNEHDLNCLKSRLLLPEKSIFQYQMY